MAFGTLAEDTQERYAVDASYYRPLITQINSQRHNIEALNIFRQQYSHVPQIMEAIDRSAQNLVRETQPLPALVLEDEPLSQSRIATEMHRVVTDSDDSLEA